MKKLLLSFLSAVLVLLLPTTSLASEVQIEDTIRKISVSDFIPQAEIEKYKGQFSSYDEVAEAFGLVKENSGFTTDTAVDINSVDEFAAFIAYSQKQVAERSSLKSTVNQPLLNNSSMSYNWVIYDAYIWWLRGYADVSVDDSNNTITFRGNIHYNIFVEGIGTVFFGAIC